MLCSFLIRQQLAGVHNSLIELGGVGDAREGQGAGAWVGFELELKLGREW